MERERQEETKTGDKGAGDIGRDVLLWESPTTNSLFLMVTEGIAMTVMGSF